MKRTVIVLAASVALLAAAPAMAAKDYNWKILAAASYVSPLSDTTDTVGEVTEAKSAVGWEIGGEWRVSGLIGFELDYLDVTSDVEENGVKFAEVGVNPINVSGNFHLIQGKVIDFWVGPTVAFVTFDDIEGVSIDSDTTYGAVAGLDIGIGKHFAVTGGLRWLDLTAQAENNQGELAIDPVFLRVGVAFRF